MHLKKDEIYDVPGYFHSLNVGTPHKRLEQDMEQLRDAVYRLNQINLGLS